MTKQEIFEKVKAAYACKSGLAWLKSYTGTNPVRDCPRPDWVLWAAGEAGVSVPPKRLDKCAASDPRSALRFCASLLSRWRLEWCARQAPLSALEYAAPYLYRRTLSWCAKQYPNVARELGLVRLNNRRKKSARRCGRAKSSASAGRRRAASSSRSGVSRSAA